MEIRVRRTNDDDEGLISKNPQGIVSEISAQRPQGGVGNIRKAGGPDGISQGSTGWGLTNSGPK